VTPLWGSPEEFDVFLHEHLVEALQLGDDASTSFSASKDVESLPNSEGDFATE
jgi:hypothetical protein